MSMPGWYPDPAGTPGRFRYWDGRQWSSETTAQPSSAPVPGIGPGSGEGSGRDDRRGALMPLLVGLLVLALLVSGFLWWRNRDGGGGMVAEDTNSSTPTISSWDERSSSPTPSPSASGSDDPAPSGGAMVACPVGGGDVHPNSGSQITGGGLAFDRVEGWDDADNFSMPWTYDMGAQTDTVYSGWFSLVSVGALSVADGFEQPKRSTQMMMSCFATSSYYLGYSGRKDLVSKAVTINGHAGWHLRSEIYVNMLNLPQVKGDTVDVIVVDLGNPASLGVFVSSYTIDDAGRQKQVEGAIATLTTS